MIKKLLPLFFIVFFSNIQAQPSSTAMSTKSGHCFVSDNQTSRWATGGKPINSCNHAVIESLITEPYGHIQIWQFLNDREIKRSFIYSAKMRANTRGDVYSYETNGNRITENVQGCKFIWDILHETPNSITIKSIGTAGRCDPTAIEATNQSAKMPPTTYRKIKN
jgi:hypothetical protein